MNTLLILLQEGIMDNKEGMSASGYVWAGVGVIILIILYVYFVRSVFSIEKILKNQETLISQNERIIKLLGEEENEEDAT